MSFFKEIPGLNNARIHCLDREEQLYVTLLVELKLPEIVQMSLRYGVAKFTRICHFINTYLKFFAQHSYVLATYE